MIYFMDYKISKIIQNMFIINRKHYDGSVFDGKYFITNHGVLNISNAIIDGTI